MNLALTVIHRMTQFAKTRAPREACGFLLDSGEVIEITNTSQNDDHFIMDSEEQLQFWYNAAAIWHSHPRGDVAPSQLDLDMQRIAYDGRPMVIVNLKGQHSVTACG